MEENSLNKVWDISLEWLRLIWSFPLYKSGDSSIAFNQVFIALSLFIVGLLISKRISNAIGNNIRKSGKLNENTTHTLQRIISLIFIVIVAFISLPIAGIPITIFTVLGSAIAIGVSYGSPTRTVEKLLLQAVREHPKVLNTKELIVLFEDFGDNALTFNFLFWSSVSMPLDLRKATSDRRFRIDDALRRSCYYDRLPTTRYSSRYT